MTTTTDPIGATPAPRLPVPPGGVTVVPRGGRVNWCAANNRIAYDRRSTGNADPRRNGWFNIYTANGDGSNEQSLTEGQDFGWAAVTGHPSFRHVGLPTWTPDGKYLLFCVEEIDPTSPASMSDDVSTHLAMQPGRGVNNSVAVMLADGSRWTWLWRYKDNSAIGSMHPYVSPDMSRVALSRMLTTNGVYGTWDVVVAPFNVIAGSPRMGQPSTSDPCAASNPTQPRMNEVNGWHPNGTLLCISGNPILGQPQFFDDVFTYDLVNKNLQRKTMTSGEGGEPTIYDEHLVYSPNASLIARMSSKGQHGAGTEVWVTNADLSNDTQVSFFNSPGHPMFVPPQGGATSITAARPTWSADGTTVMVVALDFPNDDPINSGQGPIVLINATLPAR
jgi:Tol biopolymer transport system component